MKFVVRQFSGLGNQMFQYAAGRYYAERHGAQMILSVDPPRHAVSHGSPRPFLLSHFAIRAPFRELTIFDRLPLLLTMHQRPAYMSAEIAAALRMALHLEVVEEGVQQRFRFLPDLPIDEATNTVYLVGYWQVHQMADALADKVRIELSVRDAPTGKNLETLRFIKSTQNTVSVHIRRGDYVSPAEGNIALSMAYYAEAIARIKECIPDPTFVIFSDDIEYARKNVTQESAVVFVDNNDSFTAHEDLRLMSSCRHHIIANSSFSWWGAWLNPDPDKTVFAPRKWMVGHAERYDDLFPASWRLLD